MSLIEVLITFEDPSESISLQEKYPEFKNFYWHTGAIGTLAIGILSFKTYSKLKKKYTIVPLNYVAELTCFSDVTDTISIDFNNVPKHKISELACSIDKLGSWLLTIGYIPEPFVIKKDGQELEIFIALDADKFETQLRFILYVLNSTPVVLSQNEYTTISAYFV